MGGIAPRRLSQCHTAPGRAHAAGIDSKHIIWRCDLVLSAPPHWLRRGGAESCSPARATARGIAGGVGGGGKSGRIADGVDADARAGRSSARLTGDAGGQGGAVTTSRRATAPANEAAKPGADRCEFGYPHPRTMASQVFGYPVCAPIEARFSLQRASAIVLVGQLITNPSPSLSIWILCKQT